MSSFALSYAPSETIGLIPERLMRLTACMARQVEENKAPGVSMLIARHGKIGYRELVGALRPGGQPMSDDAIFRIYSMTKPIVSVAAMMLVEEGRLAIADPVSNYIPAFANLKVGVENGGRLDLAPLKRPITIQDLMRHTSGLTYGFTGVSPVQKLAKAADVVSVSRTLAGNVEAIATLPLMHQPGEVWEYGTSTDVLGRIVEIVERASLGEVLRERLLGPLGMVDTAFFTPELKLARRADPFSFDFMVAAGVDPGNATAPPKFESGGGGLMSTLADYTRFVAMLSGGGAIEGVRVLGAQTLAFMASDHLDAKADRRPLSALAGPWLRPRLRGANGSGKSADGRQRRRVLLGWHDGHGVLGVAARLPFRHPHGSDPRISRVLPSALPKPGQRRDRLIASGLTTRRCSPSRPRARPPAANRPSG